VIEGIARLLKPCAEAGDAVTPFEGMGEARRYERRNRVKIERSEEGGNRQRQTGPDEPAASAAARVDATVARDVPVAKKSGL
jgi:hypothetical protein